MPRKKTNIPKSLLEQYYLHDGMSPKEIGEVVGCHAVTVRNRLLDHGIALRKPAVARMRYPKQNFSGDETEKAYMLGFRLGDLNTYLPGKSSETVVTRCHTTQSEQVQLIDELFNKYGKVSVSDNGRGHYQVNVYLNRTFDFLLSKEPDTWSWINLNSLAGDAFVAGYVDAEGNFIINQGRARFKLDTYDYEIMEAISQWMRYRGIDHKFRLLYKKGHCLPGKPKFKRDLWRINVNTADDLKRFLRTIRPHLRHENRIKQTQLCRYNISKRIVNGTVKIN